MRKGNEVKESIQSKEVHHPRSFQSNLSPSCSIWGWCICREQQARLGESLRDQPCALSVPCGQATPASLSPGPWPGRQYAALLCWPSCLLLITSPLPLDSPHPGSFTSLTLPPAEMHHLFLFFAEILHSDPNVLDPSDSFHRSMYFTFSSSMSHAPLFQLHGNWFVRHGVSQTYQGHVIHHDF